MFKTKKQARLSNAKVEQALSLICTEDTVKDVKKVRSDLNKELKDYEERRKAFIILKTLNEEL